MSRNRPRNEVLAQLLTPKWVALTMLVLLLCAVFALASSWQYQRAIHQVNAQRAVASQPLAVADLVPPGEEVPPAALGRLAEVRGVFAYDAWVAGRTSPSGERGVWLVSAVDDGSGLLTPVLRGWLPAKGGDTSTGQQVVVIGRVSSPENFYRDSPADAPDEMVAITDERLAEIWGQSLRPGYVVLTEQVPALDAADPTPVPAAFGSSGSVGFPWQNAGYAMQWITFIGFVSFMYWRFFRDDMRGRRSVGEPALTDVP